MKYNYLFFIILISMVISACQHQNLPVRTAIDRKSEPYDHFTFQRTYPYADFDWKGWCATIDATRSTTIIDERNTNPCDGAGDNPTNWTQQGPGNYAGRVNTLAVKPDDENTVLAGFAGGGLFRSTDGAVTWQPVFDDHTQLSIGDITFDPNQPNVVYAGTGDVNMPSILYNGNGIYKSTNGGQTWNYFALAQQGVISKIIVHPTNSNTMLVATMGNPYQRDNERGVFRTTDGGQTWQKVLFVSNQAGCSSLELCKTNPDIVYASFWDRIRNNTESVVYGLNAKVFKSIDGGVTWTQLGGGLPTTVYGRTGLAVSQQNPDKVYVMYMDSLGMPGALMKTTNGGQSWAEIGAAAIKTTTGDFGWYFASPALNPNNDEDLYHHGVLLWRRAPNSSGFQVASGGHADSHDLVWTPSGRRYWANDGGVYRNDPNQQGWIKSTNLPVTQVYRTNYNPLTPNQYWMGAQDNGIKRGSAAAINGWTDVFTADGFRSAFDPTNAARYWVETQNGAIAMTEDNGQNWTSTTTAFGTTDRVNWDAPFFNSIHDPTRFYGATYRVMSSNSGVGWGSASPDLTDGIIFGPRFHTISALSESPKTAGKLFAGTTDGNVWRQEANANWVNITGNLPDRYVTSVVGSPVLSNRIFVTHSGFRANETIPHIHRSDDNGQSWLNISGDLPQLPVNQIFILPNHADSVLFAATDAGVYFTLNGGSQWRRLGGNMPFVPVFDFAHNLSKKELVAATFGRSIWTFPLDSIFVQPPPPAFAALTGQIRTQNNAPMRNFTLTSTGLTSVDTITGNFTIAQVPACTALTLRPYRNHDMLNGVTTYDLVLISRHILNLEPFDSPYKILAGDANRSNTLTNFDIVSLRKIILGVDSTLANNTSWRFAPASIVFPQPDNPFTVPIVDSLVVAQPATATTSNWVAFKVGDVNNNADPNQFSAVDERTQGEWPVFTPDQTFSANQTLRVPLLASLADIAGAQMTVQFDPDVLELVAVETPDPISGIDIFSNIQPATNGILTLLIEHTRLNTQRNWSAAASASTIQECVILVFRTRSEGHVANILSVNSALTTAMAYQPDGTALQPVLRCGNETATPVLQVWPNPAGASGACLYLPMVANCTIQVFDNQGKLCFESPWNSNQIGYLPRAVFPTTGAYNVRVISGKAVWTAQVVVAGK